MALSQDETDTVKRLQSALNRLRPTYDRLERYYEGLQVLEHLGLAVPPQLRQFETVVNWPRLAVDAVEERLDLEGFRYAGTEDRADDLWRVWQANDMDEQSQQGRLDALIFGRSFLCVGTNEDDEDTPLVTVESPREVECLIDPRTREVEAALRLYGRSTPGGRRSHGTLYLPDVTVHLERGRGQQWVDVERDEHELGEVPVTPLLNRQRSSRQGGESEMTDVIPLTDAAARTLTNLQVAAETHAVPQRAVLGASKGDFVDQQGKPLTVWETYFGAVWALANKDSKIDQFTASDLRNFHETVNHYAKLVVGLTGLPAHYLGFTGDQPPNGESIRAGEARLIKHCERKTGSMSGSYERTMRIVQLFRGKDDPRDRQIEALWRDPGTPTKAQMADATVKLYAAGLLPREAAWEELGFGPIRRKRLRELMQEDQADPVLERVARDLAAAGGGAS